MPRVGTLLDVFGRPTGRVEIIRKSRKAARIRRSTNPHFPGLDLKILLCPVFIW